MTRFSTRHLLLGGALLVALAIWAIDSLIGGGQPASARAAQTTSSAEPASATHWQDVTESVERLTNATYTPVEPELGRLRRDLFLPTPLIDAAFAPPEPESEDPRADGRAGPSSQPVTFEAAHKLTGIMLGSRPLAVIDGQVVPLNGQLDEHVLVEIRRDGVVFRRARDGKRVELELGQRSEER